VRVRMVRRGNVDRGVTAGMEGEDDRIGETGVRDGDGGEAKVEECVRAKALHRSEEKSRWTSIGEKEATSDP
jgi:hypothetical protein